MTKTSKRKMHQEQTFVIYRQEDKDSSSHYERYTINVKPGMTVLDALFTIQDQCDPSLAFRYSCRGSICGSCGMTINKFPQLACKTQISRLHENDHPKFTELRFGAVDNDEWDEDTEILVEPLPNMLVEKDLVVNMDRFWKFYREVKPYFVRSWKDDPPESKQTPEEAHRMEHLIYCIMCGLCWTCPVSAKNKLYLGPAALAKAYRFVIDTRLSEDQKNKILDQANQKNGIPACESVFACNRVCPKGVKPGTAIRDMWKEIK